MMSNGLKSLRERLGLTQQQAADRMGMSKSGYVKIEDGARKLSADHIRKATSAFLATEREIINPQPSIGIANGRASISADSALLTKRELTPQQAVEFARACMVALEEMADENLANRFLEALLTDVQERGDEQEYRNLETLRAKVRTILRLADAGLLSRHPRSP